MLTKTLVFISIAGRLLWGVWVRLTQPTPAPIPKENRVAEKRVPLTDGSQRSHRSPDTLKVFQDTDFYRTIIENNLFRPLGWTPPRPKEPYRLIGSILPRLENTAPRAVIETTAGDPRTHIVAIGDALDTDTAVVSIENKSVVLETDGKQRTLRLRVRYRRASG